MDIKGGDHWHEGKAYVKYQTDVHHPEKHDYGYGHSSYGKGSAYTNNYVDMELRSKGYGKDSYGKGHDSQAKVKYGYKYNIEDNYKGGYGHGYGKGYESKGYESKGYGKGY